METTKDTSENASRNASSSCEPKLQRVRKDASPLVHARGYLEQKTVEMNGKITKNTDAIKDLQQRIRVLEEKCAVPNRQSIQRVEEFNGETVPEKESNMKMTTSDKLMSMHNAVKILPPNMVENGRHAKKNIEAICGFKITDEMMDELYTTFSH